MSLAMYKPQKPRGLTPGRSAYTCVVAQEQKALLAKLFNNNGTAKQVQLLCPKDQTAAPAGVGSAPYVYSAGVLSFL
jgi:hypothetical protein